MGTGKNAIDGSHVHRLARNPFVFITFFPKGKVDIVSPMPAITKNNEHLVLFKRNQLQNFPVWNIYCQNVIKLMVKTTTKMLNFLIFLSFDSFSRKKNKFLDAVKSSIKDQLFEQIESNKIFESCTNF